MNKLSPNALALLERARDADDATPEQRVRADAAVRIGLALNGLSDLPPLDPPQLAARLVRASRLARLGASPGWKLGAGVAALLAVGVIGVRSLQPHGLARSPAATATPAAPALALAASLEPAAAVHALVAPALVHTADVSLQLNQPARANALVAALARPSRHARAQRPRRAPVPESALVPTPASDSSLEAEVALIGSANTMIRAHRYDDALRVLQSHAERFPGGALREEREALRVVVTCSAEPSEQTERAVQRYLRAAPHSIVAERVRVACARADGAPP